MKTIAILHVICVLCFTGLSSEQVLTPYTDVEVTSERERVTLSCNYSYGVSLQWYRQYPKSAPQLLIMENMIAKTPGFSLNHENKIKRVDLEISSAQVTDSALYYCALQPTVTGNPETPYKNLTAHDKLFLCIF
uniref:Ig-like domain-containing protein n=1 Tax=Hucho hucho TaxID=62062 RepID=A0A4W5KP34_9TELE